MSSISLLDILKYFLVLGTTGFGGPLAIIEKMRKELVLMKNWMTADEFKNYFGYSQIAPGPLAYQVAVYFSYFKKGVPGAIAASIGLVFPSFVFVISFSVFYENFRDVNLVRFALYGLNPVIVAIITKSGFNLSKSVFENEVLLYVLFFFSIGLTIFFKVPIIALIIGSALVSLGFHILVKKRYNSIKSFSLELFALGYFALTVFVSLFNYIRETSVSFYLKLAYVFIKIGALTYGSGFVIVGVMRQEIVENLNWLTQKEFLDGLAIGQITPGPVVITSTFIGYLTSGPIGAIITTISIFLPGFIIIMIIAPYVNKIKDNFYVKCLIKGANASALGAILATAYFLSRDAIIDVATLSIFVIALSLLFFTKFKDIFLILISILVGIALKVIFIF
ncbi:MAG: chromate efflux transporter [Ignavibacteria bacterium]